MAAILAVFLGVAAALEGRALREADVHSILGITVGMPLAEVRTRLGTIATVESRATREGGTKEVWRLGRTGFEWIALKTNGDGRVVWLTARRREGAEIPFDDFSAERPSTDTGSVAIWYVSGKSGGIRVTARGRNRRAQVITQIAENP
jgi:hypothetical protein